MKKGPFDFVAKQTQFGTHHQIVYNGRVVGFIMANHIYDPTEFTVVRRPANDKDPLQAAGTFGSVEDAAGFVLKSFEEKQNARIQNNRSEVRRVVDG